VGARNKVVYVKNPNYVRATNRPTGWPAARSLKVDRVEWIYIPDQNTALAALTKGEADIFELPQADFIPALEKDPNIKLAADSLGNQGWLRPNHLQPPFNNPKARQALQYIINQEEYLAAAGFPEKFRVKYCPAYFMCGSLNETAAGAEPFTSGQNIEKPSNS